MKNFTSKTALYRLLFSFLVVLISFATSIAGTTYDWIGKKSTDWNTKQNWSPMGVPVAGDSVNIGLVALASQPAVLAGTSVACQSITIGGIGNVLTVSGNLTVSNAITINVNATINQGTGTTITANSVTVNAGGTLTQTGTTTLTVANYVTINSGGSFTQGSGNLNISGNYSCFGTYTGGTASYIVASGTTNQTISGTNTTLKNLTINGGSTVTLNANVTVDNAVLINASGTLTQGANTLTVKGNYSCSGTYNAPSTSFINFAGTSTQTVAGTNATFKNVNVNTGSSVTLNANVNVDNNLVINGTLTQGATNLTLKGNYSCFGTYTGISTSFMIFAGSANQTILGTSLAFSNVTINAGSSVTLNSNATVNNALIINGTLSHGANNLTLIGNYTCSGTYTALSASYITFAGTSTQTIAGTNASFKNATVNAGSSVALNVNATIDNNLLINGTLTHAATNLTLRGNYTCSGTYSGGSSSFIVLAGSTNQSIAGTNVVVNNLTINPGSYAVMNANVTVNNILQIDGTWDPNEGPTYQLLGAGAARVGANGTAKVRSDVATYNYNLSSYNYSLVTGATVDYCATIANPQIIYAQFSYSNLKISGKGVKQFNANYSNWNYYASNVGNIYVTAGTLDLQVYTANRGTTGGILSVSDGAALKIGGINTLPIFQNYSFGTTSTVEYYGTGQTVAAAVYGNLLISDPAVSIGGPVKVANSLGFGNINNSVITTNGLLTLGSSSTTTANLLDITNSGVNSGNTINGVVTIERYIQGKRAYRFLTAPVNTSTSIKYNWMENVNNTTFTNINPTPFYGTQITGNGGSTNNFDVSSTNNPSLFTFNLAGQSWTPVANTNGTFAAGTGYRIMVRGSRNVNLFDNNAVPSATTLRATGTVLTGDVTFTKTGGGGTVGMPSLSTVTDAYSYIGNPYPSDVNFDTLAKTDVASSIYVFDPTVSGSSSRGAYVSYNTAQRTNSNINSEINNHIQSGQGFFVQTTGPNPSITFRENYKSTINRSVFRTAANLANLSVQLLLPKQVNTKESADGLKVYFSEDYANSIGDEDSYKFTNQDENIAVLRNGKILSLEGRRPITGSDSVPLKLWQLSLNSYTLKVRLDKFPSNVEAYLTDKYLGNATPLSNGETLVPFAITSNASSAASDRFKIVFESLATLPVRLTGIKAYLKNKGVEVDWTAQSESNIDFYEIESSPDGHNFKTIGSVKAKNNAAFSTAYSGFDAKPGAGDNYYRIKSVDKSGEIKESEVVKVHIATEAGAVSVFPNPVIGKIINVVFTNEEKGRYTSSLVSSTGQTVYTGIINHPGGSANYVISTTLPRGIYELMITTGDKVERVSVAVQ